MAQTNAIGSSQVLQGSLGTSDRVTAGKKEETQKAVVAPSSDSTAISSAASSLSQISSTTDDVRTEKVAAIQSAIANGTYSVSASAVADKLIQHLLG